MAWLVLICSGVLEAVWAAALSASQGFTRRRPTLVFAIAVTLSMAGLGIAVKQLPIGTAYAVWVGVGAALTVVWGFVTRQEQATWSRVLLLVVLVASIAGLKVVS